LMDSLIKEYPTGTMLTWETNKPPELKGPHKYDEKQGAVRILLDGQQRVTTLYMLIRGEIPPYYTLPEITNDTRGLHVNVKTLELEYYSKGKMENDPRWQNVTDIFQRKNKARDIIRGLEEKGETVSRAEEDLIDDNMSKIQRILERDFPEQTIPIKANVREAIDIFYKVNASGVALTEAELALAQISGYWPQARDIFKAKLTKLEANGFVFKLDFLVYVLLGCLYHVGSDMRKLHDPENNQKIREAWEKLDDRILDYVASILKSHAFIDHTDEINSVYALIPIIVYCFDRESHHLNDTEIRKMVKWFYYSQIRTRYISQLPQKLDKDLNTIATNSSPFDALLNVIAEERRLPITPEEFVGRDVRHPLFGLVRWYFKSQGAVCFTTGVALRQNMGAKYQLEKDHIFPFSKLKNAGYGIENRVKYALAQELTNRAILTQCANRTKSDSNAEDYLRAVKNMFPQALALQCVPDDESLWRIDKYEDFLAARRKILADRLNKFLESITVTEQDTQPVSLEEMIAEGESDELEFKSSLRWDYRQQSLNKKLEDVILKSVSAFANSQGGTLLIGVNDDGKVLGLEPDYTSLGEADKDKFELHLRNLLNEAFGISFVATRLTIKFPSTDGHEICQIEIAAASQPIVLKVADKNGQVVERIYVRNGNSSQELPLSEAHNYLKERFG
ncbi:MAG: RNA-binding domain-containing protein, partial [Alphaproteobacteria bacterium]